MKQFFQTILAIVFFATILSSCNQNSEKKSTNNNATSSVEKDANIKYYRHILFSETPYDKMTGTYELTAEQAAIINNYKFSFDSLQRIVSVEFNRNGVLLPYARTAAAKILINYTDSTEIHTYFDKDNEPAKTWNNVYKAVYSLNESGERTGLAFYNDVDEAIENRNNIAYYRWTLLPDGMVKENRFNLANEEVVLNKSCPFYELRFSYDKNGFATRMANYSKDKLYNCMADNCGDIGVSYFSFVNSPKGDLQDFSVYNTDGDFSNLFFGWARFTQKFDEAGNVVERTYFDQEKKLMRSESAPVRKYAYDEHGSVSEIKMLDGNGELKGNTKTGIALIQYKYDDAGLPKDTLNYDATMKLL